MNLLNHILFLLFSLTLSSYLIESRSTTTSLNRIKNSNSISNGFITRLLRKYKVCTGVRCQYLKSLSPFTASLLNVEDIQFLHYSRWTRWSPCSRHCSTNRYRACRFPLSCGTTVIHEEAFCYHRGTHCELIYQSSLGDFLSESTDYSELGGDSDSLNELFDPPSQLNEDEWNTNNNLLVAPTKSKKKGKRQPKKYIQPSIENNRRRSTGTKRNNTRTDNNFDIQSTRLGYFDNRNSDNNGPFPIEDYNEDNNGNAYSNSYRDPFALSTTNTDSYMQDDFTCGVPTLPEPSRTYGLSRRILGGSEVKKGRWPWQVAILNRMQEAFCGGTLIAPRWILTAAHCVRRRIYVTIGEHHLHRNDETEKHYRIEAAFIHPDFETDTVDSDIALLLLPEPVPIETGLACLPYENQHLPSPSTVCTILGWGKQKYNHVFGSQVLHEGKVPIVSNGECRYAYGQYEITGNMFCAGYSGGTVDSCAGDSGGPLLCTDEQNRWTVFGVTSFGDGCGRKGKYGIYAKVPNYVAWIKKVMQVNMNWP